MNTNKINIASFFKLFKLTFKGEIRGVLKAHLCKENYCYEKPGKYKGISRRGGPGSC